jgi:hypothetical protein
MSRLLAMYYLSVNPVLSSMLGIQQKSLLYYQARCGIIVYRLMKASLYGTIS